jgi:Ca2+-binding RTX toxin-like protein
MGRGSGGRSRGRGNNGPRIEYEFEIFAQKDDGSPSTFDGAIENFTGIFDESSQEEDRTLTFPNQTTDLTASRGRIDLGGESRDTIDYKIDPIKYEYDASGSFRSGTVELKLSLFDDDDTLSGFQAIVDKNGTPETITLDDDDISKATSSIDYIISEGLFSSVDVAEVTGTDGDLDELYGRVFLNEGVTYDSISSTGFPSGGFSGGGFSGGGFSGGGFPGTNGDDNLTGDDGDNVFSGDGGNDSLTGGGGDDLLNGGNGDDILDGGAGQDVLVGDGGADIFVISTLEGDVISDFDSSQDLIGLSDGITFDDLTFTQDGGSTILSYQDQAIASISGATAGQFDESLFTEV